jgi:hypothetical protein
MFDRRSDSRTWADPVLPRTASQSGADSRSSTAVRVRKETSRCGRRARSTDWRYSTRKRSSPANSTAAPSLDPAAFAERAARYSATGQPSVRRTSSSTSTSERSTPAARRSIRASCGLMARSSGPISSMRPPVRRRASGGGGSPRLAITSCDCSGRRSARAATASRHSQFCSRRMSSRTSTTGSAVADRQDRSHGSAVSTIGAPGAASAWNTAGSMRSIRSSATAM